MFNAVGCLVVQLIIFTQRGTLCSPYARFDTSVCFFIRGKVWDLKQRWLAGVLSVPDPRQTPLRLVANLLVGGETHFLQR